MTLTRGALVLVLAAAAGAAAAWRLKPAPAPEYSRVVVDDAALWAQRPKAATSLGQKILTRTAKPILVASSLGAPDRASVSRYCSPLLVPLHPRMVVQTSANFQADSLRPNGTVKDTLRTRISGPILPPFSGRVSPRKLELFATRSDGSLWQGVYPIHGRAEWVAGADSGTDTLPRVRMPRRLLGLFELKVGGFAEAEFWPTGGKATGRSGVRMGESLQFRIGLGMGPDARLRPFAGANYSF